MTFNPMRIFGPLEHYIETTTSALVVNLALKEGTYRLRLALRGEVWRRPYLPFASRRARRAHIECRDGIPMPRRTIYHAIFPADSLTEAVSQFTSTVLRERLEHGGANWTPSACAGPFVDARDCPVHDPRVRAGFFSEKNVMSPGQFRTLGINMASFAFWRNRQ